MQEEKEKVRKLTDEELDQVTGGNCKENRSICKAIYDNKVLFNSLTGQEQKVILAVIDKTEGILYGKQKNILAGILSEKLGIDAKLNSTLCSSTGTKDGVEMTASDIVTAIGNYHPV